MIACVFSTLPLPPRGRYGSTVVLTTCSLPFRQQTLPIILTNSKHVSRKFCNNLYPSCTLSATLGLSILSIFHGRSTITSLERMLEAFIKDTRPELSLAEVSSASKDLACASVISPIFAKAIIYHTSKRLLILAVSLVTHSFQPVLQFPPYMLHASA